MSAASPYISDYYNYFSGLTRAFSKALAVQEPPSREELLKAFHGMLNGFLDLGEWIREHYRIESLERVGIDSYPAITAELDRLSAEVRSSVDAEGRLDLSKLNEALTGLLRTALGPDYRGQFYELSWNGEKFLQLPAATPTSTGNPGF